MVFHPNQRHHWQWDGAAAAAVCVAVHTCRTCQHHSPPPSRTHCRPHTTPHTPAIEAVNTTTDHCNAQLAGVLTATVVGCGETCKICIVDACCRPPPLTTNVCLQTHVSGRHPSAGRHGPDLHLNHPRGQSRCCRSRCGMQTGGKGRCLTAPQEPCTIMAGPSCGSVRPLPWPPVSP